MAQTDEEKILFLRSLEQEVTEAEAICEECKVAAANAKKVFDGRVNTLREAVRKTDDPQTELELEHPDYEVIDDTHQLTPPGPKQLPAADVLPPNPKEAA